MHSAGTGLQKILFRPCHILLAGLYTSCASAWGVFSSRLSRVFSGADGAAPGNNISPPNIGSTNRKAGQVSRPPDRPFGAFFLNCWGTIQNPACIFLRTRKISKALLHFCKSNINSASAALSRQVERGEKPHESVTVMPGPCGTADKPDTPRLNALCRNRTAKILFPAQPCPMAGPCTSRLWRGTFFRPGYPVFSLVWMGPRPGTIYTIIQTRRYTQRPVRTPDLSERAFGPAGREEKNYI